MPRSTSDTLPDFLSCANRLPRGAAGSAPDTTTHFFPMGSYLTTQNSSTWVLCDLSQGGAAKSFILVGPASAGLTVQRIAPVVFRDRGAVVVRCTVGIPATSSIVAAGGAVAFRRTPGKEKPMPRSARISAPAADAVSVLDFELRRMFGADGVIDFQERRMLNLSRAASLEIQCLDSELGIVGAMLEGKGLRGDNVQRKLREFRQEFDGTDAA